EGGQSTIYLQVRIPLSVQLNVVGIAAIANFLIRKQVYEPRAAARGGNGSSAIWSPVSHLGSTFRLWRTGGALMRYGNKDTLFDSVLPGVTTLTSPVVGAVGTVVVISEVLGFLPTKPVDLR